jgi:hypothetical protein
VLDGIVNWNGKSSTLLELSARNWESDLNHKDSYIANRTHTFFSSGWAGAILSNQLNMTW